MSIVYTRLKPIKVMSYMPNFQALTRGSTCSREEDLHLTPQPMLLGMADGLAPPVAWVGWRRQKHTNPNENRYGEHGDNFDGSDSIGRTYVYSATDMNYEIDTANSYINIGATNLITSGLDKIIVRHEQVHTTNQGRNWAWGNWGYSPRRGPARNYIIQQEFCMFFLDGTLVFHL